MRRLAVTAPFFDFFPELKVELEARYPGTRFRNTRHRFSEDELVAHLQGCDTAVIGIESFTPKVLEALPDLRTISMCSAGVDHIDPDLMNRHGIDIWWAPGINRISVSELTIAYIIIALRRVSEFSQTLRRGEWKGPVGAGGDLFGRTVGIHGCGHIGKEVVKRLRPFGVTILASDRIDISSFCREEGAESVGPEELWTRSDVLSLHLPINASTRGLYTAAVMDRMKPGAILINCARGNIVDEAALAERLRDRRIAGAAFDVFAVEPANGNPLIELPNMFASPHIGATTRESWLAMLRSGIEGIEKAYRPQRGVYPFD